VTKGYGYTASLPPKEKKPTKRTPAKAKR
jgi:hypothetical protein